jgi:hypothetical protein
MDARTPASLSEPPLPLDLPKMPKSMPRGVDAELWRIAHRVCPATEKCSLETFGSLAAVVVAWFNARSMSLSDAAAWLQRYGESRDLPQRFGTEKMQLALEVAFDGAREEDEASEEERGAAGVACGAPSLPSRCR